MNIIESLRYEMRRRIIVVAGIVDQDSVQREWYDAPKSDLYIRETVMEYSREEDSQCSELLTVLCEYDVFVRDKAFINPMASASDTAAKLLEEFNVKNPEKININLDGWSENVVATVARYNYGNPTQEETLARIPVLIYVEIRIPESAEYVAE